MTAFILPPGFIITPVVQNPVNYGGNKMFFQAFQPQAIQTFPSNKPFALGATFTSFENLTKVLEAYQEKNNVQFWMRDSRTLETAAKRSGKRVQTANKSLKYFEIRYCCVHGGQRFKSRGEGRRIVRTLKQDCPAHIGLRLSDDGQRLEVNSCNEAHNHEISSLLIKHLPKRRRISEDVKKHAADLLKLGVNKTLLQQQLSAQTGNVILFKDLVNISSQSKQPLTRNNVETVTQQLEEVHKAFVEVSVDVDNNLQGLVFQDRLMMDTFQSFPQFIILDTVTEILDIKFPVHMLAVEDGNGQTEVAAVAILDPDRKDAMHWFLEKFKLHNLEWRNIRCCMNVKDLKECKFLEQAFPSAKHLLCSTNTLRAFKKDISAQKMDISDMQRTTAVDLVKKMLHATDQSEYNSLVKDFQRTVPINVKAYFMKNWHPVHEEWVPSIAVSTGFYISQNKIRLASLNSKLKSVINKQCTLEEFVELFFCVLKSLRSERDHKAANVALKVAPRKYDEKSAHGKYSKFLTPYAFSFVWQQLESALELPFTDPNLNTTTDSCECGFRKGWLLPCQHILTLRSIAEFDLFEESLCHVRWSAAYYFKTQRVFGNEPQAEKGDSVTLKPKRKLVPQSVPQPQVQEKNECTLLAEELAAVVSEASGEEYENRMEILRTLLVNWKSGKEMLVSFSGKENVDNEVTVVTTDCLADPQNEEMMIVEPGISVASVTVSSND